MGQWQALAEPWKGCFSEATTAYLQFNSAPIGAVVVGRNGDIISRGHNHLSSKLTAHAEMGALSQLTPATERSGLAIYSTLEPCPMCAGAVRMCRLPALHFAAKDPAAGSAHLLSINEFMRSGRCEVHTPEDAVLEGVVVALNTEFRVRSGRTRWREQWRDYHPVAVDLGTRLVDAGAHGRWTSRTSAEDLFEQVAAALIA